MITVEHRNERIFALQVGTDFVDHYDVDWDRTGVGLLTYVGGGPVPAERKGEVSEISNLEQFIDHYGLIEVDRTEWCETCKEFYANDEIGQCGHPREED